MVVINKGDEKSLRFFASVEHIFGSTKERTFLFLMANNMVIEERKKLQNWCDVLTCLEMKQLLFDCFNYLYECKQFFVIILYLFSYQSWDACVGSGEIYSGLESSLTRLHYSLFCTPRWKNKQNFCNSVHVQSSDTIIKLTSLVLRVFKTCINMSF